QTLVSRAYGSSTQASDGQSDQPAISGDGRYVAFTSSSSNLVPNFVDGNQHVSDVFLFDRLSGSVTLVSHEKSNVSKGGNKASFGPLLDYDGRVMAFSSNATDLIAGFQAGQSDKLQNAYAYDRVTGTTKLLSHAYGSATKSGDYGGAGPVDISDDGLS